VTAPGLALPVRRRRRVRYGVIALTLYVFLFLGFIAAPIVSVVAVSFSTASFIAFPIPGFTLRWYWRIVEYKPFVDALTTILDPDLPLTVIEWEEWGDPLHDPEAYQYVKSYTPYENLRPVAYPAILATTSLNDTRVFYVEPAKWVAALRHDAGTGSGQLLLKTEMVAGHGGVSGRYKSWRELAFEYAWLMDQIAS